MSKVQSVPTGNSRNGAAVVCYSRTSRQHALSLLQEQRPRIHEEYTVSHASTSVGGLVRGRPVPSTP